MRMALPRPVGMEMLDHGQNTVNIIESDNSIKLLGFTVGYTARHK